METKEFDARKVDRKTLEVLRRRVISLRKKGKKNIEIARMLGLAPQTTSRWWQRYQKEGESSLKVKKDGRPKGSGKILSEEQERQIIRLLIDKTPRQLKFPFALWTRESVQVLIERTFGITMPLSTVGLYLQRWQFTSKKPIRRAYERKDAQAKAWMKEEYPRIRQQARKEGAEIWWADETSCIALPNNLTGYAPIGKKPILEHPAKKFRINMISAITPTGKTHFALYDEPINTDRFIEFLEKAIESSSKKLYMILDNLRVHHAKKVREWVEEHQERIALFYLPAYSPDLNPDEYLNQDYKQSAHRDKIPTNKEELKANTLDYMNSLQNNPEKVKGFFRAESLKYISECEDSLLVA